MKKIFDQEYPNLPSTIISDNGGEFKGIESYNARQNSFIERWNGTIKRMIGKYLTNSNGVTISNSDR